MSQLIALQMMGSRRPKPQRVEARGAVHADNNHKGAVAQHHTAWMDICMLMKTTSMHAFANGCLFIAHFLATATETFWFVLHLDA